MRRTLLLASIGLFAAMVESGCTSPAPRPVAVPPTQPVVMSGPVHEHEHMKPLPPQHRASQVPPPYNDVPLVSQTPPEQPAFLDAYQRVGHPRMMIMAIGPDGSRPADKSYKTGPIDYDAIETVLGDWLSCNGAVNLVSPHVAPATPPEPTTKPAPAPQIDADVLIRVDVHPRRNDVKEVRLITEAINTRGGESIGRAVVDVPTPLERKNLDEATHYIARKLMDEMTQSWQQMLANRSQPAPAQPAEPESTDGAMTSPAPDAMQPAEPATMPATEPRMMEAPRPATMPAPEPDMKPSEPATAPSSDATLKEVPPVELSLHPLHTVKSDPQMTSLSAAAAPTTMPD